MTGGCSAGTGTTMSGLLLSGYPAQYLCFPALKGGHFLKRAIAQQLLEYQQGFSTSGPLKNLVNERLSVPENYHFGGYAKFRPELISFMNEFYEKYGVMLDPVYTGKMMYGITEMINHGEIKSGSRVLAIHTGGLQGIKGMNQRLRNRETVY
ncbi:MAG: hypothetical protein U5L96_20570 [Owenweeksia sp.]|nr:hypothetical protein [Owenweeksia sp.]